MSELGRELGHMSKELGSELGRMLRRGVETTKRKVALIKYVEEKWRQLGTILHLIEIDLENAELALRYAKEGYPHIEVTLNQLRSLHRILKLALERTEVAMNKAEEIKRSISEYK